VTVRPARIAVLFHEADRERDLSVYIVHHFAELWRARGHAVAFVFGTAADVPADVALVHVDLSVVPDEYLAFARRYPVALNARVKDIRKATVSRQLVRAGDTWAGPVIVKSDLNAAGRPERSLRRAQARRRSRLHRVLNRWREWRAGGARFASARDYRIYERLEQVPAALRSDPRLVVERFLPERDAAGYHVRVYHFLGDRGTCARLTSPHPIVTGATACGVEAIEPHPEIVALRRALGFDYGKFDYVLHEGRPVLLDANKTTAHAALPRTPERLARWRHRAEGIDAYLAR
jgi:hypothetical protein